MSLNCNEIDEIINELNLVGTFIQEIIQPCYDSIALNLYKNGKATTLFICLAPGACRLHSTKRKIPKNNKPLRFMEFMRSRIKGARINSFSQINSDRIIKAELGKSDENFTMYIRLWSSASNIIITDKDNIILDSFFRRPSKSEISGAFFTIPDNNEIKTDSGNVNSISSSKYQIRTFNELPNFQELNFNEKVEEWYGEHAQALSRESLLIQAEKLYSTKHKRMETALHRLEEKRETFSHAEKWKHQGDLILSYGHLIDGASDVLECNDYETGENIKIKIDKTKRAQENAADYYTLYKKALSGIEDLEYDIKRAKSYIAKLEADYELICKEQNPIKIQQLIRYQNKPKQQIAKAHPGLSYIIDGWYIIAGRGATENDELLRHYVKGPDLWLHTRDFSGGFIFIKNRPGKTVPLDILLDAGNLAVWHSKARKAGKADLYYTHVKYLRRAKNAPKGLVLPTHEKNLTITLDNERLKRLEESLQE